MLLATLAVCVAYLRLPDAMAACDLQHCREMPALDTVKACKGTQKDDLERALLRRVRAQMQPSNEELGEHAYLLYSRGRSVESYLRLLRSHRRESKGGQTSMMDRAHLVSAKTRRE
jgi:hypothetical protein